MISLKDLFLQPPRLTLAVAESLTCGHVQALAAAQSGASEFFLGGMTAYNLEQKVRHLGVERAEAQRVNSVSASVAEQMARGVGRMFGSDLAVATTGWAEPAPNEGVTVPFAWWALVHLRAGGEPVVKTGRIELAGAPRIVVQAKVAEGVIAELVRYLMELRGNGVL